MKTIMGIRFFLLSALLVFSGACAESSGSVKREGTIKVVTTTAMIGDLVRNVAGEKAEVISLMGTGLTRISTRQVPGMWKGLPAPT